MTFHNITILILNSSIFYSKVKSLNLNEQLSVTQNRNDYNVSSSRNKKHN